MRARDERPSQRPLRVGEAVRHALVEVFARGHIRDPDLAEVMLTISEVRMSPDLRHATVFVTQLGGGEMAPVLKALKRAAPYLRSEVARLIDLRYAPDLHFQADTSFEVAGRISDVLMRPEVRRDLEPPSKSGAKPKRARRKPARDS